MPWSEDMCEPGSAAGIRANISNLKDSVGALEAATLTVRIKPNLGGALRSRLAAAVVAAAVVLGFAGAPASAATSIGAPPATNANAPTATVRKGLPKRLPPTPGRVGTLSLASGYQYAQAIENPASAQQSIRTVGTMITSPTVRCSGGGTLDHSLWELTVHASSTSTLVNVVEFGFAKEPVAFGDCKPRLFASCWDKAGAWGGSYQGGCGYTPYSGATVALGADLSADVGTAKQFAIQYVSSGCTNNPSYQAGWAVGYGSVWVGCFPLINTTGNLAATFTSGQQFRGYWEVYKGTAPSGTCLQMGDGTYATATAGPYMSGLTHGLTGGPAGNFTSYSSTSPSQYSIVNTDTVAPITYYTFRGGGTEPAPC